MTKTNQARMYEREMAHMVSIKPIRGMSQKARKNRALVAQQKANLAWLGAALALVSS